MFKKATVLFLIILLHFQDSKSQDPEFSQFFAAPLYLNPAMAGISYGPRVNLIYRNQWPAIDKGFVTYAASYDMHIDAIGGGLGVLFFGDRIANGLLNTYSIKLMYAYQFKLSKKFGIKAGIEGGYTHRRIDWARLTFSDQIDPIFGFDNAFNVPNPTFERPPDDFTSSYADFGVGFVAFSPKVFGGMAVKHITKPKDSFTGSDDSEVPIRIDLHAGGDIDLAPANRKKNISLSPNILFAQQSSFTQLNAGTYVNIQMIYTGLWYRATFGNPDAVIALLGLRMGYVNVAYSYDFTISELRSASGGAHEVSFSFNLGGEDSSLNPKKKQGRLNCPSFLNY